jgi:hypothetical protein
MVRSGHGSDNGERIEPLDTLLDRLIPTDEMPGALDLALGPKVCDRVLDLDNLLERLASFATLSPLEQDALLRALDDEGDPVFASLVVTVHELYYADHRSWPSVGYTTNLPGRP